MSNRKSALNAVQLEVLKWVENGSPDGVYSDWSHRVTARALHHRGLVVVRGRGDGWQVSLTDDGAYYLENRAYPPTVSDGTRVGLDATATTDRPRPKRAPKTAAPDQSAAAKSKKPGRVDQMMAALQEAEGHRILVASNEQSRYRQLASLARRMGRVPDGMHVVVRSGGTSQRTVSLEPLPAWQTAVLEPVPVSKRLKEASDVVTAFSESDTFQVTGRPRERALRIADALVMTARSRGIAAKAMMNQPLRRDYGSTGPRRDEIEFAVDQDRFRLWFTQEMLQKPHEPTQREVARAERGYLFPDFDEVPDEHLGLLLEGDGGKFWADRWRDEDDHRLEDDLAQILEEIRLRHEQLIERRAAERERQAARQRQYQKDREQAISSYRRQFLVDAMKEQATRWETAGRLRRYAEAVRAQAERLDDNERIQSLMWADQIATEATRIDPLAAATVPPTIPKPSDAELGPFMRSGSPYH